MNGAGAGHGDADKLAAARELAQSFKKGGSGSDGPRGRKKNKKKATLVKGVESRTRPQSVNRLYSSRQTDIPPPRPQSKLEAANPPINIPLPSQRRYEDSLSANPFQRGPGPIMGSRAMDFLNRQDTPKPAAVTRKSTPRVDCCCS